MAKKLYLDLNYVIADLDPGEAQYAARKSYYKETTDAFIIHQEEGRGTLKILKADVANWEDAPAGGFPYNEAGMRTFLRTNTAIQ